jgi:hypothetical protein
MNIVTLPDAVALPSVGKRTSNIVDLLTLRKVRSELGILPCLQRDTPVTQEGQGRDSNIPILDINDRAMGQATISSSWAST